jgi:hypothetical protein
LVQEVIAATVTAPWSSSYVVPSGAVTVTGLDGVPSGVLAGASEAGKDSLLASMSSAT